MGKEPIFVRNGLGKLTIMQNTKRTHCQKFRGKAKVVNGEEKIMTSQVDQQRLMSYG